MAERPHNLVVYRALALLCERFLGEHGTTDEALAHIRRSMLCLHTDKTMTYKYDDRCQKRAHKIVYEVYDLLRKVLKMQPYSHAVYAPGRITVGQAPWSNLKAPLLLAGVACNLAYRQFQGRPLWSSCIGIVAGLMLFKAAAQPSKRQPDHGGGASPPRLHLHPHVP